MCIDVIAMFCLQMKLVNASLLGKIRIYKQVGID